MKLSTLEEIILSSDNLDNNFLYLAGEPDWNAQTLGAIYFHESDETYDAAWSDYARQHDLHLVFEIAILQDVIWNAKFQKSSVSLDEIVKALNYYYIYDAFMQITL